MFIFTALTPYEKTPKTLHNSQYSTLFFYLKFVENVTEQRHKTTSQKVRKNPLNWFIPHLSTNQNAPLFSPPDRDVRTRPLVSIDAKPKAVSLRNLLFVTTTATITTATWLLLAAPLFFNTRGKHAVIGGRGLVRRGVVLGRTTRRRGVVLGTNIICLGFQPRGRNFQAEHPSQHERKKWPPKADWNGFVLVFRWV